MKTGVVVFVATVGIAVMAGPKQASAQVDQPQLARQILGSEATIRRAAVLQVERMGSKNAGPELRAALIAALERDGEIRADRYRARRRGETLEPLEDPELVGPLTRTVAALQDPAAIPALAGALGTGFAAIRALEAFGEQAAPTVLATVLSRDRSSEAVDSGLITLRMMVEGSRVRPLSAGVLAQIRRAAEMRLTEPQEFVTTVWRAIDLAVVLDDAPLRRLVDSIAADPRSITLTRGKMDAELAETTRRRAVDRLGGVLPKPRP